MKSNPRIVISTILVIFSLVLSIGAIVGANAFRVEAASSNAPAISETETVIVQQEAPPTTPLDDYLAAAKMLFASLIGVPLMLSTVKSLLLLITNWSTEVIDKYIVYVNFGIYALVLIAVIFGLTGYVPAVDAFVGKLAGLLGAVVVILGGILSLASEGLISSGLRKNAHVYNAFLARNPIRSMM